MKSVKEVLRSPGFFREISQLLYFFAALSGLYSLLLLLTGGSNPDTAAPAITFLIQAIINFVLATGVRRGSVVFLWISAILFVLDIIISFALPLGNGQTFLLFSRGFLILFVIRYVQRERSRLP